MAIQLKSKIVNYEILEQTTDSNNQSDTSIDESVVKDATIKQAAEIIQMHEKIERPEMLLGSTYKIKTPQSGNRTRNATSI